MFKQDTMIVMVVGFLENGLEGLDSEQQETVWARS